MTKNTCERAFDILAKSPGATFRGATGAIELCRKFPHLAGTVSNGARTFTIRPCDRIRWLVLEIGWGTVAEIDQRDHWDKPEAMAQAVLDAIEAWGESRRKINPTIKQEA